MANGGINFSKYADRKGSGKLRVQYAPKIITMIDDRHDPLDGASVEPYTTQFTPEILRQERTGIANEKKALQERINDLASMDAGLVAALQDYNDWAGENNQAAEELNPA